MNEKAAPTSIKLTYLKRMQKIFQKDIRELIEIFISDSKKQICELQKALTDSNLQQFIATIQELRQNSADVGALQFSHYCLTLEIAATERRFERLKQLFTLMENKFAKIEVDLKQISDMSKA